MRLSHPIWVSIADSRPSPKNVTCDALRSSNAKLELTAKPLFRRVVAALYHAVRRGYRRNGQPVPGRILHPHHCRSSSAEKALKGWSGWVSKSALERSAAAIRRYRMLLHTHVCFTTCDALRSSNAKLELTAKPLFRRVVAALYHAVRRGYRRNGQPVPGRILHPPGAPTAHLAPAQSSSVDPAVRINSSAAVVLANSMSPTAFARIVMTSSSRLLTESILHGELG